MWLLSLEMGKEPVCELRDKEGSRCKGPGAAGQDVAEHGAGLQPSGGRGERAARAGGKAWVHLSPAPGPSGLVLGAHLLTARSLSPQYMGCIEILRSMRSLDFNTRTQVTR